MAKKSLKDAFASQIIEKRVVEPEEKVIIKNKSAKTKAKSKAVGSYKAPSRDGKKFIGSYVDAGVAKQLRILAAEEESTNDSLIKEALNDLFQKYNKSRIA